MLDVTARDPRPLSGGRILLHATPVLAGQVDAVDVLAFAEGVRGDMGALKGIYIALAGLHRGGARGDPVEPGAGRPDRRRRGSSSWCASTCPTAPSCSRATAGFELMPRRHAREGAGEVADLAVRVGRPSSRRWALG